MEKYPIDKELVKLRKLHLPNNRFVVMTINTYLSTLPAKINKSIIDYQEWKNGDVTMHMFTPVSLKGKISILIQQ